MNTKTLAGASFLIGCLSLAAPAQAKPCSAGPYMVFFDQNSSSLKWQAKAILDAAANEYSNCANAKVLMAGHTDRVGTDEANIALSRAMVNSVRQYLTTRGIASSQFTVGWYGERQPLVPTQDDVSEPQNRRVEFLFESVPAAH